MSEQRSSPDYLARRLDQALPAGKTLIPPVTPNPLVNTAAELAKLKLPTLSPQGSTRVEAQMFAAFDEVFPKLPVQPAPRALPKARNRRWSAQVLRYGLVASLVLIVLIMGLTPAVYASVPSEPLYSVKLLYEKVELSTALTSPAKTVVYLSHAEHRADEAVTLLDRGQYDAALVEAALQNVDAAASTSTNTIRSSARLRSEVLVISVKLDFVRTEAQFGDLITANQSAQLEQELTGLQDSALMVALPPSETLAIGSGATEESTETPNSGAAATVDCSEHGRSCDSLGVPSGNVIPGTPQGHPTHQPTNTPRPANPNQGAAQPPPRPANVPPSSSGGGGSGGTGSSSSSGGGGGGNSSSGSSGGGGNGNSGNSGGGGNSNAGGNGHGKGS